MEKTGDVQMVDNEENKLFLFSCDFYGLYRVWVRKEKDKPLQIKSLQGFFLFSTET